MIFMIWPICGGRARQSPDGTLEWRHLNLELLEDVVVEVGDLVQLDGVAQEQRLVLGRVLLQAALGEELAPGAERQRVPVNVALRGPSAAAAGGARAAPHRGQGGAQLGIHAQLL